MKIKLLSFVAGIALTGTALSASAQKAYTEGMMTLNQDFGGMSIPVKSYFTPDSTTAFFQQGPATIKILANTKATYFAVLVDVPVAQKKIAGVATPDDIEQQKAMFPTYTFTPTTETKQISGFNCKKVIAKDAKAGNSVDIWVTNDITVPVQYQTSMQGRTATVTIQSVVAQKVPAGTFGIPADYDKMSLSDLKAMAGGGGH
jgi:hypothetical protein